MFDDGGVGYGGGALSTSSFRCTSPPDTEMELRVKETSSYIIGDVYRLVESI